MFIVLVVFISAPISADVSGVQKGVINSTENTTEGYRIAINFTSDHNITINYTRVGDTVFDPSVSIIVDKYRESRNSSALEVGGTWKTTYNLTNLYDVSSFNHSIEVYTLGPQFNTTLTKEYDLADPNAPAPHIEDVEVIESTYNGDRTAALDVVFENPSPRYYQAYVFAHTLETRSIKRGASVPVRNKTTVTRIHLREGPDEEVEGELRMTTARLDEDRGLRDQVWFRGTADGETEWQREAYEPVGYQNSEDPYRYDNDEGFLESKGVSPKYAAAGAVLGIGFLIFLFRGRNKW